MAKGKDVQKSAAKPTAKKSNAVEVGIGLGAAAVAAAGAYFLYGSKSAAKNRKVVNLGGHRPIGGLPVFER